ncbi:hypothetical protein GCM10011380_04080 [Sphingomonas metalli]|uniref:Ice-binding protein C-terminal domain-containing protein n=2 Tax=Sphingomonas metalli TaxID=1779358 RepID=A0A916WMZ4_9SPHN|nr:hypothetical protein GCM10011380_04080 [Sphingomonas metalli]
MATAAVAAVASAPAAAATQFTVNSAASNIQVSNKTCLGNCNVTASLATFSPFSLNVGQSTEFNFANFVFTGTGVGSANVSATLAFSDPFATATTAGTVGYLTFFGALTGGALNWSTGTQTLTASNGASFSVRFNDLVGVTGGRATSTVTVRLLAAAVPEPATWGMMLLGFGMVAGAARYRRAKTNVTYA